MGDEVPDVCLRNYKPTTDEQKSAADNVKRLGNELIDAINKTGKGRGQALGVTNVEQGVMWAVKSIFNPA